MNTTSLAASIRSFERHGQDVPLRNPTALAMDREQCLYVLALVDSQRRLIKLKSWQAPRLLAVSGPLDANAIRIAVDGGVDPLAWEPLPTPAGREDWEVDPERVTWRQVLTHSGGLAPWHMVFRETEHGSVQIGDSEISAKSTRFPESADFGLKIDLNVWKLLALLPQH